MKRLETPHVRGVTIAKLTLVPLPIVSCVMPPPEIIFSKKVIVLEDSWFSAQSPLIRGAFVQIFTNDGKKYEKNVLYSKGEPENPISYEEIAQKTEILLQSYNNVFINSILNKL